jgi:membrane-associated phospholipid phosphatase
MRTARTWSVAFVLTIAGVVVSYFWLDRPIAQFAHDQTQQFRLFELLTRIPEFMIPVVLVFIVALGLRALLGRSLTRIETVLTLAGASLSIVEIIKDQLKFAFGRTWPETWVRNNPSFIHDGVYGFNPFHGGAGFASFPSGHTAASCAILSVFWICYPRFRGGYALAIALVGIGLVGADFHFLGDVIAGGFLGTLIGWLTVAIWEAGARPVIPTVGTK